MEGLCHKVWGLNIPPKVKHFIWKALHDFLALDGNLAAHHVPVSGFCCWCKRDWGSTTHTLIWCDRIRSVWKGSKLWEAICRFKQLSLTDLSLLVLDKWGDEELEEWFFQLWMIWRYLYGLKHGDGPALGSLEVQQRSRLLASFQKAREQVEIEDEVLPSEGVDYW